MKTMLMTMAMPVMITRACNHSGVAQSARVAMALSALSGDEQGILFVQLCNALDPGIAVALTISPMKLQRKEWPFSGTLPERWESDMPAGISITPIC